MNILDIFIGLVSIYLTLSLVVTAVGEGLTTWLRLKSRIARRIVVTLLGPDWAAAFYRHPNILRLTRNFPDWVPAPLARRLRRSPSYIPPELFADTLLSIAATSADHGGEIDKVEGFSPTPVSTAEIDRVLQKLPSPAKDDAGSGCRAGAELKELWQRANLDPARFREKLLTWFDHTADRSYGWHRRDLSLLLFAGACLTVWLTNADTIQLYERLSRDADLRESLVEQARDVIGNEANSERPAAPSACAIAGLPPDCSNGDFLREAGANLLPIIGGRSVLEDYRARFELPPGDGQRDSGGEAAAGSAPGEAVTGARAASGTAPGESSGWERLSWWLHKLAGLFLTAAAISLGAPFWFDVLRKIVQVRGAITTRGGQAPAAATPAGEGAAPATPVAPAPLSTAREKMIDAARLDSFEHAVHGLSPVNLFWCARLCEASYLDAREAESRVATEYDGRGRLLEARPDERQDHDTQVLLVSHPRFAVIAFRGTENKLVDWSTDLDITPVTAPWCDADEVRLHRGFSGALDAIWPALLEALRDEGLPGGGRPIWFTGHSLGGALAALAALRLLAEDEAAPLIGGLHTFGQPRVGNRALARGLDRALGQRYLRCVNNRDIVPRLPLPDTPDVRERLRGGDLEIHDYAHAGRVVYFSDLGRAVMDPPLWYRTLDTLAPGGSKGDIADRLRETAGDHAIAGYVAAQRRLLETALAGD